VAPRALDAGHDETDELADPDDAVGEGELSFWPADRT
jgi:hypothetical protein